MKSIRDCSAELAKLKEALEGADAVVVGAGSGLSASAGFDYAGPRFEKYFADFIAKYHFPDMYTAGFFAFPTPSELWAYWSRHIFVNRYMDAPRPVYDELLKLVKDKDYFVITTNVDHCFQKAGFDKERLFYTQGDYGLWQCSVPCHLKTYDNKKTVLRMVSEQQDMKVPTELVPHCPICGAPVTMNLRSDDRFVEDEGWHRASDRYAAFIRKHDKGRVLYLELGVGGNTPGVIKYPFWRFTAANPESVYVCLNQGEICAPKEIEARTIGVSCNIGSALKEILAV